jgi:rhodanese-related sulfurtransferase
MNTITASQLKEKISNSDNIQLIDIREAYEFEEHNIGGLNIPMENVLDSIDQIDSSKEVIICCKTGQRAIAMVHALERKFNLKNIYALTGGVFGYLGIKE